MPDPSDYDDKDAFISDCISEKVDEGKSQENAAGACHGIWEESMKTNRGCSCEGGQCACDTGGAAHDTMVPHAHPVANVETESLRTEQLYGREHRVAPVVAAIADSVMNNAFVPLAEWQRSLPSWNGRPIPVNHPETNGQPISANTPQVLERSSIGQFFNAELDDEGRFKGELWIDVERANEIAPDVLNALDAGTLEVSTAYFAVDDPTKGEDPKGNSYQVTHRFLLPDHLAVLPNQKGACSWEDGCGAPRTHQEESMSEGDDTGFAARAKQWLGRLLGNTRYQQNQTDLGESTRELEQELMSALEQELGENVFVETVFYEDRQVVYEVMGDIDEPIRLYQRSYQRGDDGSVTFMDDLQEVRRVVSFEPVTNDSGEHSPAATHSEVSSMADKEQRIGELIGNDKSPFAEEDRETLQAFSEEKVEALAKSYEEAPAANGSGEPEPEPAPATPTANTAEEYIEAAPAEVRDSLRTMQREHEAKRRQLIDSIKANEANAFSEDELAGMDTDRLQKLANFARKPSYEGRGAPGREADLDTHDDGEEYEAPSLTSRVRANK